jgi:hypothetical protein
MVGALQSTEKIRHLSFLQLLGRRLCPTSYPSCSESGPTLMFGGRPAGTDVARGGDIKLGRSAAPHAKLGSPDSDVRGLTPRSARGRSRATGGESAAGEGPDQARKCGVHVAGDRVPPNLEQVVPAHRRRNDERALAQPRLGHGLDPLSNHERGQHVGCVDCQRSPSVRERRGTGWMPPRPAARWWREMAVGCRRGRRGASGNGADRSPARCASTAPSIWTAR